MSGGGLRQPGSGELEQLLVDFAIGSAAATLHKTATAPWERIKMLMATRDSNPDVISGKLERFQGIRHCISCTRAEQGVTAFWRGNLVNCLRYAPQQGSVLALNDALNNAFPRYDRKTQFWQSFGTKLFSGGVSGAVSTTVFYPLQVTQRMLARDYRNRKFKGTADGIMTTVKAQGVTALYTGCSITVAGAFVYRAGQLGCFKLIQDMNPYKDDKGYLGVVSAFLAVTTARTVVMPFNYPFDTVRRRMMLQSEKAKADRMYSGSFDCFLKVLKKEGRAGIYKGMYPELFRGVGGSFVVVCYDRVTVQSGLLH